MQLLTLNINSASLNSFIKESFFMKHYIYFDHSATTPALPEVASVVTECMTRFYGNPSEPHSLGIEAKEILDSSRTIIADALNAEPSEIIFTSGGTESNNIALFGACHSYRKKGNHIIATQIEHPCVILPLKTLARRGYEITLLPVGSNGIIDPDDVKKAIKDNTIMVSVMHANNVMGTIQPIKEIGRMLKERNILFHSDAVQTFSHIKTDVDELNVDLLSLSAHKFYGPKGTGALYIRKSVKVMPQVFGGGQERSIRSGTENVPAIAGMARAVQLAKKNFDDRAKKVTCLRDYLIKEVLERIEGVFLNGHPTLRLPGNANFIFKNLNGMQIVKELDEAKIAVSSSSACSSSSMSPSHALMAIGICDEDARGSVRVSLGFENTKEEVDYFIETISYIVRRLRGLPLIKDTGHKYFIFGNH